MELAHLFARELRQGGVDSGARHECQEGVTQGGCLVGVQKLALQPGQLRYRCERGVRSIEVRRKIGALPRREIGNGCLQTMCLSCSNEEQVSRG